MILWNYRKDGYVCLDESTFYDNFSKRVFFKEDATHSNLFEYITKDLSHVPDLFKKYVQCRLDLDTVEARESLSGEEYVKQIEETLKPLHPYYQHAWREACINALGRFFNRLLAYHCYYKGTLNPETAKSQSWYIERLKWMLRPFLKSNDPYLEEFYQKYRKFIWDGYYIGIAPEEIEETVLYGVPHEEPKIFADEIFTQKAIQNFLYFVLDFTARDLQGLNTFQRLWLFKIIFANQFNMFHISVERNLTLITTLTREYIGDYNKTFDELCSLEGKTIENGEMDQKEKKAFDEAVKIAKARKTIEMTEEYKITSLEQILTIEIISMIQNKTLVRKCKNCGKYFIVTNRNTAYCDRKDETGHRCSSVGPSREFQKKMEDDEALKIYTRAYKTHFARVKKGTMKKDAFTDWCEEAKEKLKQARAGSLNIDDYQTWLKK